MKTVLVPTDFNPDATKIIDALVLNQKEEKLNIIFVHAFKLSDSITDMLMLSRRSRDYENVSDTFYLKLNQYKTKYSNQLGCVGIEYFYGSTVAAFKNFIDAFDVDCVAYLKDYDFQKINKYSIEPKYLTERCGCQTLELDSAPHQIENNSEYLMDTKIHENRLQTSTV
ncbi:hypothetical protein [Pedobacter nototheniae]|uniref:hypothetical protein n=1 Tax=Pedobacter nototheniae TaxID=2488994 RepID=UPI00292F8685|nr:hypothetical protein [Pedobacter nototheniae]